MSEEEKDFFSKMGFVFFVGLMCVGSYYIGEVPKSHPVLIYSHNIIWYMGVFALSGSLVLSAVMIAIMLALKRLGL